MPGKALLLAFCFTLGTFVTVSNGIGRQTEGAENKVAAAETANQAIADKRGELKKARHRLADAEAMVQREMTGQKCGPRCTDWKTRAGEVQSHIAILDVQLQGLGAPKPVNPKAAKIGELAALFGADGSKVKAAVVMLDPLMIPTLLECSAMALFAFGLHRGSAGSTAVPHVRPLANDRAPLLSAMRIDWIREFRRRHGRGPTDTGDHAAVSDSENDRVAPATGGMRSVMAKEIYRLSPHFVEHVPRHDRHAEGAVSISRFGLAGITSRSFGSFAISRDRGSTTKMPSGRLGPTRDVSQSGKALP